MKTLNKAFAIVLFSLPLLASAAGKISTASMQVSFEVKESCNVQSSAATPGNKAAPAVACQLNSPYAMTRTSAQAAAAGNTGNTAQATAIRQQTAAGEWTVTF
jgi:hypothetical protein